MGSEIRDSLKSTLLGKLAGGLMRLWVMTLRMEVVDRVGLTKQEGPLIYALWHNRIFCVPYAWRRLCRRKRKVVVLTSASHDGGILANAVSVFGIGAVRGSSSRRGVAALVALRKTLRAGIDVCVTPDGPRGPRYVMQPGLVKLAETSGAQVIPIHVDFTGVWRFKSWDRFCLPKPFSKVRVIFDEALAVPGGLADDDFEHWRSEVENRLRAGVDDLEEK